MQAKKYSEDAPLKRCRLLAYVFCHLGNRTYFFYLLRMTILDRFSSGSHLLANLEYQQQCQCSIWVLKRADWVKMSSSFASQWTKNRSFWRCSSQPISQCCTEETKPNATRANNTETMQSKLKETSGYATMVHGRGGIRIAVRQLSQTWTLRHYDVITRKL